MLGKLFGSKTRVKILKLFISHPEEKFYIRQITRDLKLQLNSVRRELDNLENFGLLISNPAPDKELEKQENSIEDFLIEGKVKPKKQKKAKIPKSDKKYYKVNTDFILYHEIKALIVKAQVLYEKDFIDRLNKVGSAKLLVLAGYFVNDAEGAVDIMVVGRFNRNKFARLIKKLEKELGREINYTLMNLQEFKYRRDITDVFLYDILERKKLIVINDLKIT